MSREIKFRVWDIKNQRMFVDPERFEPAYLDESKVSPWVYYETWSDREDGIRRSCHVMQFTGLKDKNGVEIYEGDVVKLFHGHPDWIKDLFLISFQSGAFALKRPELAGSTAFAVYINDCLNHGILSPDGDEFLLFEIVGNIHTNPDLL